jgi:site-specific DNA recombinase
LGEVPFKGEVLAGEQAAIMGRELFDAVQCKLNEQRNNHTTTELKSEALLLGRIFDDRGNRMSPSHARKGSVKYRYYLSSALLHGQADRAGSVRRAPAVEIERLVVRSVRDHLKLSEPVDDRALINIHIARVEVRQQELVIELTAADESEHQEEAGQDILRVPWQQLLSKRGREILIPESASAQHVRPIRSEARATLVASIARGRRWLDELVSDPAVTTESIAAREGCSVRKINMTISLAFLAPDLVKAAIEGTLPQGMGVARLCDLPAEWSRQHQLLGLSSHSA